MLLGIDNQQYIDPGIGEFKPPTGGLGIGNHLFEPPQQTFGGIGSLPQFPDKPPQGGPGDLPMGQHPLMGVGPVTDQNIESLTPPPTGGLGIDNQQYIDPGVGEFKPPTQDPFGIKKFGEQLGGYGDVLGGFEKKMGGFGEQITGFNDQFRNINDRLSSMEQGITSLTEKFGTFQQPRQRQNFGMNPFGSFNSYNPFFGGLGMFMRRF